MILSTLASPQAMNADQANYAQFKVLHAFTGGADGGGVWDSVVLDRQGNLYGTTSGGGAHNGGTVFELMPQPDGNWSETVLHSFPASADDGGSPFAGVMVDASGNLYGTTPVGGSNDRGIVFELEAASGWAEQILHTFCSQPNCSDGVDPWGNLIMDSKGNLYGTGGVAFELSPNPEGGWTEIVLHDFTGQNGDGSSPRAGMIFDSAGNLYGTTQYGGIENTGIVYQLQPVRSSLGGSWRERILHQFYSFPGDGTQPSLGQLAMDSAGNLYGTTAGGGPPGGDGYGTVFKLTRVPITPEGVWVESILHSFGNNENGTEPGGGVILDRAGNLYGTTIAGGSPLCGCGVVFKLAPQPDGSWQYTVLHTFVGSDGAQPDANLTLGPDGSLYGTTATGGAGGAGVVFEMTP